MWTKDDKMLILNKVVGIPTTVLNKATVGEIDRFIKRNNLEKYFTEELLNGCKVDRFMMSVPRDVR